MENKIYSIEIRLTQGLTLDDYKELADDIESAVHQCNYPVDLTFEDGTAQQEDVIVSVDLIEKSIVEVINTNEEE